MRNLGHSYQHHHVPEQEPPAHWPRDPDQKTPMGKGVDCSNFTGFVYNLALGIFPSTGIKQQSEMTEAAGPGAKDANGVTIPDGVQLRAFKRSVWYFTQASHVLRIIPEDK
ncbi:MAG: hypothetical protein IPK22_22725 [Verrucomicrobiaceae bacterium]|nr:hypothetical protein [Verrucomicrobiaceae bacterium]